MLLQPVTLQPWRADEVAECLISDENRGLYAKLWRLAEVPVHQEVPMPKQQTWWPKLTSRERLDVLLAFHSYEGGTK